ncbi:MAG: type II toxin-antitoxin system HipA family toxin, partial [Parachlamydiaceae bacterium]|nr:type II toxin-antitoxin system HipA family toxin [Parachlamydiaceae bacterium]
IKKGLELSPFKLPLKTGVIASNDRTFEGLFGVFNDSLPDGWGRLLLDRKLMSLGVNPGILSPLDRLFFVGSQGMGTLSYEPENQRSTKALREDLDEINHEIQITLEENDTYVDDLLILGGSSAGARPKVLLHIDNEDWLIKFRSSLDPKDIGAIEYAYHLMSKEAGLNVPEAKLFPSRKGLGFFGVKRFDRKGNKRIHMHTLAGLLHADHREPSLDYETIMKATIYLTRDVRECEVQFRNAVFNVLSHNRDDHSKNFSFLMDKNGIWSVSPAYDLTFSSGLAGEHTTMIMGEGKNPTKNHLLKLASIGNIKKENALKIIEQVSEATHKWYDFAENAGVSKLQNKNIGEALDRIDKSLTIS